MRSLIALGLLSLCFSCSKAKPPTAKRVIAVRVAKAEKKDVPLFAKATGHVEAMVAIDIKPQVEGQLLEAFFDEGSYVKKGDLLYKIDPRPFEAKLQEAKAALDESISALELAEDKVNRYKPLVEEEYYSVVDYEQLTTSAAVDRASVDQNRANVEFAALQLEYCSIYSPIDGAAGSFHIDPGNLVFANGTNTLVSIQQLEPIYVTFSLPENQLQKLFRAKNKGRVSIEVELDTTPSKVYKGSLFMIDNQVDRSTGMILAKALFENRDHLLWPGEFVEAKVIFDVKKGAITIPYQAILFTPKGPAVFLLSSSKSVELRLVKMGERTGDEIIIEKGVEEDDSVVIEGQFNLSPGSEVVISPPSTSKPGGR